MSLKRNKVFLAGVVCALLISCNNIFHMIASSGEEESNGGHDGEYTVIFDKNGGKTEANPQTMLAKAPSFTVMLPNGEPERDGHIFTAWNTKADGSGTKFTRGTVVKANMTVYAQWLYLPEGSFIVKFDKNGGENEASPQSKAVIPSETTIDELPEKPIRTGYTFDDWNTQANGSGTAFTASTTVTGNITVYAQWTAITYTVVFNSNGGSGSMSSQGFTYDAAQNLTANAFTRTGHTFTGWATSAGGEVVYTGGQSVLNLADTQGATVNLYAVWNPISYTVVYYKNADEATGTMAPSTHTYDEEKALTVNAFARAGYAFVGWNTKTDGSGTDYTNGQSVQNLADTEGAMVSLYAQWKEAYTIIFSANGAISGKAPDEAIVIAGDSITLPGQGTLSKIGHSFGGWNILADGSGTNHPANTSYTPTGNITLYAKWTAITYTVVYMPNGAGGGTMANSTHTYGVEKNLTANGYTRTGYTFEGWATTTTGTVTYANEEPVTNLADTQEAKVNLYAVWKGITYTVRYDNNGGSGVMADQDFTYGTPQSLRPITFTPPANHSFAGWARTPTGAVQYAGGHTDSTLTTEDGDTVTLYAIWAELPKYTVSFNINGGVGTLPAPRTEYAGTPITLPGQGDLLRANYTFGGWNTNAAGTGSNYAADAFYTGNDNITLYARWYSTVRFNGNNNTGGTAPGEMTVTAGSDITLPGEGTLSRTGYTFGGWNTNAGGTGTNYNAGTSYTPPGNIELFAKWNLAYTVRFNGNNNTGGTAPGEMTVEAGSSINLPGAGTLSRTGYTFDGWNANAGGTGTDYAVGASYTPTGNTELFAKWVEIIITPPDPPEISGTITLAAGGTGEVENVLVQLYKFDLDSQKLEAIGPPVKPNASGEYLLPDRQYNDGLYFITASLDGYITEVVTVTSSDQFPVDLTLDLQKETRRSVPRSVEQMIMELMQGGFRN
jgi:uncharacterized repeat protein (TIGR02543 family)